MCGKFNFTKFWHSLLWLSKILAPVNTYRLTCSGKPPRAAALQPHRVFIPFLRAFAHFQSPNRFPTLFQHFCLHRHFTDPPPHPSPATMKHLILAAFLIVFIYSTHSYDPFPVKTTADRLEATIRASCSDALSFLNLTQLMESFETRAKPKMLEAKATKRDQIKNGLRPIWLTAASVFLCYAIVGCFIRRTTKQFRERFENRQVAIRS